MKTSVDKKASEPIFLRAHHKEVSMLGTTDTALTMGTIILCSWAYGLLVYMFATWSDGRGDL